MTASAIPVALLVLVAVALGACGGDDPAPSPAGDEPASSAPDVADADPGDVEVIDEWARALADGDIEAAAEFFSLPSIAENGPTVRITTRAEARLFNASLPCGAELAAAQTEGEFTTATFELTERPGPGRCGPGTGGRAQTTFVIDDGLITEWRRVGTVTSQPAPGEAV